MPGLLVSAARIDDTLSALVPSGYPSSAQNDGDGWDGAQGENEDEPDEDEKEPDADENEPAESENGEDDGEDDDGEDSKDSEGANNSKQWSQEKFRFEVEIDANTAHPFLHSILPKDGDDLDIYVELNASRDSYLLRQLLSELGGAIHDAADIVGEGASGGSGDFIDGSAQNGTLTTQTTRRASTSGDSSGKPGGKVILRVRSHLQSKDDAK